MEFALVKKIITAASAAARKLEKELAVSVASNGVLAERGQLAWLARRGVRFAVSFSGSGRSHDLTRKFASGKGTHAAVAEKIPLFISVLGEDLHAILCVHPRRAAAVYEDFLELAGRGFKNIGIECVHGAAWRPGDLDAFSAGLKKIARFVLNGVAAGEPVVLEPFLEFFRANGYAHSFCPFLRDLELYPDGVLSFYPYPFLRSRAQRAAAAVGSAGAWVAPRYRDCVPSAGSRLCVDCARGYYRLPGNAGGSRAHALRTRVCLDTVKEIIARAPNEPAMKKYLKHLIRLFKKGYI